MILLFLDDSREFEDVTWVNYPQFTQILTVRTAFDFCNTFADLLMAHDLRDISISFDQNLSEFNTGKVFANYLIDIILTHKLNPNHLNYYMHSIIDHGEYNIRSLIRGYTKFYNSRVK